MRVKNGRIYYSRHSPSNKAWHRRSMKRNRTFRRWNRRRVRSGKYSLYAK